MTEARTPETLINDITAKIEAAESSDIPGLEIEHATEKLKELRKTVTEQQEKNIPGLQNAMTNLKQKITQTKERHQSNADLLEAAHKLEVEFQATEQTMQGKDQAAPQNGPTPTPAIQPPFFESFEKADGAGKMKLVIEKIGEWAEKISDFFASMGSSSLLAMAGLMEKMGMNGAEVDALKKFAGSEKAILQSKLQERNLTLIKDPGADGKNKDRAALGKLRDLYLKECDVRLRTELAKPAAPMPVPVAAPAGQPAAAPAAPAPAPLITINTIKAQYTFDQFVDDPNMNIMQKIKEKSWEANVKDTQGRPQLTLSDIVSVLPQA